jgi:hypothetical protein
MNYTPPPYVAKEMAFVQGRMEGEAYEKIYAFSCGVIDNLLFFVRS